MTGAHDRGPLTEGDVEALSEQALLLAPLIADRLAAVRVRIEQAGGDPEQIRLVGVTKTLGPESALAGIFAGIHDLGENYADELLRKAAVLSQIASPPVTWHFIGAIQRNKIPRLASVVSCWQSVSRAVEGEAIAARAGDRLPSVFVEVNLARDPARPGCPPRDAPALVRSLTGIGLEVRGLMAVAPLGGGADAARSAFGEVARLRDKLNLPELSIGMSGDLEEAVGAGTTMVRIGTALFGPRDQRAPR